MANEKYCFSCATKMHESANHCPSCGARQPDQNAPVIQATLPDQSLRTNLALAPNQVFCRGCGKAINQAAPYCPQCGAPQAPVLMSDQAFGSKNKVVAALLAFFLGGFGIHKFYLGEIGMGVLYLLFCWTFIPAIIAFIEGIVYLSTSDQSFARKYR